MFDFVYPGESAHLLTVWNGLDGAARAPHPFMGLLAKPFGLTNGIAPVLAVLAAVGLYFLVSRVVRRLSTGEDTSPDAVLAGRLAGGVALLAFIFQPATLSAGSHVEPALFGLVGTILASLALVGALAVRSALSFAIVFATGLLFGFFAGECPLASVAVAPAGVVVLWCFFRRVRAGRAVLAAALFGCGCAVGFLAYGGIFAEDFASALLTVKRGIFGQVVLADGGGARAVFAALPFLVTAILLPRAFGDGLHLKRVTIGFLALLALAVFGLFADFTAPSVASAAMVASVTGVTFAYFVVTARADYRNRAPAGTRFRNVRFVFRTLLAVLLAVFAVCAFVRAATSVDRSYAFADRFAARVLDALGSRTWLVTDGRLDDHLRILANRRGLDLAFVNLSRDLDPDAKKSLAETVTRRLGARAPELLRSLKLGFLPFLEDWLKADPAAARTVAVFAAPDILFACGQTPVPEIFLFGTDPKAPADWSAWTDLRDLLSAPKGWGSAALPRERDPLVKLRLDLRRHLGLVANNRGVWLQDHGDDAGAYGLYSLVVDEIDADNVSALINLLAMSEAGFKPAAARAGEIKKRMKAVVADETRRYRLWALANYYGTIRNVPALLAMGHNWAKSGRPGEALAQIRRAADLVPSEQRGSLMNMMAALLADADRRAESRKLYERRLADNGDDHAALIGLVRLELLEGDEGKARAYLERAVAAGGDDPRIRTELALLAMMKGDSAQARDILKSVTAAEPKNVKAWSLLSAATMQLSDATKDPSARAVLDAELEKTILPTMQTHARGAEDYYVHSARAFLAMRRGEEGRRAARAALLAAVQTRPDIPVTRELLIGMDVALNDSIAAEMHAREVLRTDRNSPMANYVMGSLALGKDDLATAEAYLKKAVAAKKPTAYALNDYAETLRLQGRPDAAEPYARRVTKEFPDLYAGWDTLAAVILDLKGDSAEALAAAKKAVALVTENGRTHEACTLLTLARAQAAVQDQKALKTTLRKLENRVGELSARQKAEYERLRRP